MIGLENCYSNSNGKIWLFCSSDLNGLVIADERQQITMKLNKRGCSAYFLMGFVYAKNKENLRVPLRENLSLCSNFI